MIDGAWLVHILKPASQVETFREYASDVIVPYIARELEKIKRVDVIFDRYDDNSLKDSTRKMRGDGVRIRVTEGGRIPSNWETNSNNKT